VLGEVYALLQSTQWEPVRQWLNEHRLHRA